MKQNIGKHNGLIWMTFAAGFIAVFAAWWQSVSATEITVYKSPSCGCCEKWVEHLKRSGFEVNVKDQENMSPIKQELGVEQQYQSCHTAIIDGYLIEGHVPAADIRRLLSERPDIRGLAVPGMPMGSPGMEGPRKDHYQVVTMDKEGGSKIYSEY